MGNGIKRKGLQIVVMSDEGLIAKSILWKHLEVLNLWNLMGVLWFHKGVSNCCESRKQICVNLEIGILECIAVFFLYKILEIVFDVQKC